VKLNSKVKEIVLERCESIYILISAFKLLPFREKWIMFIIFFLLWRFNTCVRGRAWIFYNCSEFGVRK